MKASILRAIPRLVLAVWITTAAAGCAIFQPDPPAASVPQAAEASQSQPTPSAASDTAVETEAATADALVADAQTAEAAQAGGLSAAVERIVAAVRGEKRAAAQAPDTDQTEASESDTDQTEASESEAAPTASSGEGDGGAGLPGVGANALESETVEETNRDWIMQYGLPLLAGWIAVHFFLRVTQGRRKGVA